MAEKYCVATGVDGTRELIDGENLLTQFTTGTALFLQKILSRDGNPVKTYTGVTIETGGAIADGGGQR